VTEVEELGSVAKTKVETRVNAVAHILRMPSWGIWGDLDRRTREIHRSFSPLSVNKRRTGGIVDVRKLLWAKPKLMMSEYNSADFVYTALDPNPGY
jgi:hypothetical protein